MSVDDATFDQSDFSLDGYQGQPEPVRTLYFNSSAAMEVHLVASLDRMQAFLKIAPGPDYTPITADMLYEIIRSAGIGIDQASLTFLVAHQNSPIPLPGFFQIAQGIPMRRGEDGYVEFYVQPSAAVPRYDQNDNGGIDFKQLNLLENCFAGQRVATIIPPGVGKAGQDIFGGVIPPQPGSPLRVAPGPGVVMNANGRDFSSEIEGRLIYENNMLSVSPVLEITQDIDYGVGNIDFIGKVVINGSLLDGFSVKGKNGVEIRGDVGAATIISDGDVEITGGIRGKDQAHIECLDLKARYIDNASVEAKGNVTADKEILHSTVKSLGKVSIEHGSIIGGEVWGFQGVVAENIGSELGVATTIAAGLSWTDENIIADVRGKIAEFSERVTAAELLLAPLLGTPGMSSKLTLDQKSMISDLVGELRILRDNLAQLIEEKDTIANRRHTGRVCRINVLRDLYMGVKVRFTAVAGDIKNAVKGPLSVIQEQDKKMFRVTGMTPLAPEVDPASDDEPRRNEEA